MMIGTATTPAAYDDLAGFYEALLTGPRQQHTAEVAGLVLRLVPPLMLDGSYLVNVVDLCCGPGLVPDRIRRRDGCTDGPWWHLTGVDLSTDQLARASRRYEQVVEADASDTQLPAGSADLVLCVYGCSDVADWPALVAEARRLLVVSGVFVVVGGHPAYSGPDAIRHDGGHVTQLAGRYVRSRFARRGAGFTPGGLREKVGMWHRSLTVLQEPFGEGWALGPLREAGGDPPSLVGWTARKVA